MAQVHNLIAATAHAAAIGLPFTRMVTIHWEAAGVPLAGMAKATGRFIGLLTKTLARRHCSTAWLWVHENGNGKGGHCHLLLHLPASFAPLMMAFQKRWLRTITGQPYRARVIRGKPIGGRLGLEGSNPELHVANVQAALVYILKGVDPKAAPQLSLDCLRPGGRVIGKRSGTS